MTQGFDRSHKRAPKYVYVPLSQLHIRTDIQVDRQFDSKYKQFVLGKASAALTRISAKEITSGFFERRNDQTVHVTDVDAGSVRRSVQAIREGHRHALYVYWNPLAEGVSKYVCPDDEAALAAYRELNIDLVPCIVLKPRAMTSKESSVWFNAKKDGGAELCRVAAAKNDLVASFVGLQTPKFNELLPLLIRKCRQVRKKVRAFHLAASDGIHYHQMLYAVVRRHESMLDSVARLVRLNRVEHACAVVRVAYEAFLNFYVDWLSPQFFGPRLQALAIVKEIGISTGDASNRREIARLSEGVRDFEMLLGKVAERARLSPLGSEFHDWIYPPLSLVSHQSYGNIALEAFDFSDQVDIDHRRTRELARWLDLITAALVVRVRNEIGDVLDDG